MDHTAHGQSLKLCPYKNDDGSEKVVEPGKLLEEFWFFGNLLIDTKPKSRTMSRSLSDPCTSYDKTYESIEKEELSCMERKERNPATKGRKSKRSTLVASKSTLLMEELEDEEMEFSLGKLIRQASLNSSIPQKSNSTTDYKGLTRSCSNMSPRQRSIIRPHQLKTQKSLELNQGLGEYTRIEEDGEKNTVWAAPQAPRWGGNRSTEEMKAQIKFWARAVASNVRQEC